MADEYPFWDHVKNRFEDVSPVFLILLVVYLYNSIITPILPKPWKAPLLYLIIGYFAVELVVKYLACRDPKYFLYNYWIDILLVIPIFKSLKLLGVIGKSLKFLKFLPYLRKVLKLPKLAKKSKLAYKAIRKKLGKLR